MTKEQLIKQIELGLSTWKLADYFKTSQPNIRYWLKKYNLKTIQKPKVIVNHKICYRCQINKELTEFYKYTKSSSYCKKCIVETNKLRQRNTKQLAVEYKGGKCSKCGYNKCLAALDFHHIDPNTKDKNYFNNRGGLSDSLKKELDKCILLCSNCHREEHHLS